MCQRSPYLYFQAICPHFTRISAGRLDDWAWSKGRSFGTILVDLERSEVVDLLPTRSAKALSDWLAQHPEVMVVSRDRQGVYAEGTRCGAPEAVQIADRFHLTLNLREAVERELAVRRPFAVHSEEHSRAAWSRYRNRETLR